MINYYSNKIYRSKSINPNSVFEELRNDQWKIKKNKVPAYPIQHAKIRQNLSRPDPTRGSIRPVDNSVLTTIFRVLHLKAHATCHIHGSSKLHLSEISCHSLASSIPTPRIVCMYVINIYLVSAPFRAFPGALMNCSKWMSLSTFAKQMRLDQFFWAVTVRTYCGAYRCGQFIPGTWSSNRKSSSLHRCRPTAWNNQAELFSRSQATTSMHSTLKTRTQSSCKYEGALWLMEFATSSNVLNFARCAAGNQWRFSRIRLETGWMD